MRWAGWPPGIRRTIGLLAAAAAALVVGWVLFVPVADWLATHDVGRVAGSLRTLRLQTARDDARGRLLTFGAGLFAAGALIFTARNFTLSRRTFQLTEQGQVTDRYTKAIEQLGSGKIDIRIGGVYALERIAHDSARDHPTVMEVLAVFIREHSLEKWASKARKKAGLPTAPRPDVQAALTVIGRRNISYDRGPINLTDANLLGADLEAADLTNVNFYSAHLDYSWMVDANITGATFSNASLTHANIEGVNVRGTDIGSADLTGVEWPEGVPLPPFYQFGLGYILEFAPAHSRETDADGAPLEAITKIKDDQWLKRVSSDLDEMLRNPNHAFREIEDLGKVFGDSSKNLAVTREVLEIMGVRRTKADLWIREDNWERDQEGKITRGADGLYPLT